MLILWLCKVLEPIPSHFLLQHGIFIIILSDASVIYSGSSVTSNYVKGLLKKYRTDEKFHL